MKGFEMNLNGLSDADLKILLDAVMNVDDDNEAASAVAGAVIQEQGIRAKTGAPEIKIGWRIEFYKGYGNKWADGKDSYFGPYTKVGQFFATQAAAEAEIEKINKQIKARYYDNWKTKIKPQDVRFVRITTLREVA